MTRGGGDSWSNKAESGFVITYGVEGERGGGGGRQSCQGKGWTSMRMHMQAAAAGAVGLDSTVLSKQKLPARLRATRSHHLTACSKYVWYVKAQLASGLFVPHF